MKPDALAAFVEAIRQSGLLESERCEQVARWAAEKNDAQAVAREIVRRGWLTAFQVRQLWKGRGCDLVLGQYVVLEKVGEGGMGEVFKARHRRMGRDVALKVIRKEKLSNPEIVRRFHREIQAAAQLLHPNVVTAYDADQAGDRHFFAMEYVEGKTLTRLVQDRGPLPIPDACEYVRQAALGLQHAHDKGLVHRDIKPSNLLVTDKGGVVKILDMGLALLTDGTGQNRITLQGMVMGTPDFLAPEQARNSTTVDVRADIYGLGCTLYYLLTGQVPYPEGTSTEKLLKHSLDPVPDVRRLRSEVPPGLSALLQKMMAKKPEERFQVPFDVVEALAPFCGPPPPGARSGVVGPSAFRRTPSTQQAPPVPLAEPVTEESEFELPEDEPPGGAMQPAGDPWLIVAVVAGVVLLIGAVVAIYLAAG